MFRDTRGTLRYLGGGPLGGGPLAGGLCGAPGPGAPGGGPLNEETNVGQKCLIGAGKSCRDSA